MAKSSKDTVDIEQTIILEAKGLLPVISKAIGELEEEKNEEAKVKLQRFKKWQKVLAKWQEEEIPESMRAQRLEEIRDLLVWDESYG